MTYTKWKRRPLDAKAVLDYIEWAGAPSIIQIKEHFATDSDSVRRACGKLMYHGVIIPMPWGRAQCFILKPQEKGKPNLKKLRDQSRQALGYPPPGNDGAPDEAGEITRKPKKRTKSREHVPYHGGDLSGQPVKLPSNYKTKDGHLVVDMPRDDY